MNDDITLGRLLGQREAFNLVAARCSAGDAHLLRELRDRKLYIGHAKDWGEFCASFLHTSKETANRLIQLLNEFGPGYFEVAQITRISPATYRAIAPAVKDRQLEHNGEVIDLVPENARKVAAAVAEMRKAAIRPVGGDQPEPAPPVPADPIAALEQRCHELVDEVETMIAQSAQRIRVKAMLGALELRLKRLELTV